MIQGTIDATPFRVRRSSLLIALLLVPLLFSRHDHATREAQGRPCTACILAHHPPVVSTVTAAPTPVDVQDDVVESE